MAEHGVEATDGLVVEFLDVQSDEFVQIDFSDIEYDVPRYKAVACLKNREG